MSNDVVFFHRMDAMNMKDQSDMNRWLKYWAVYGFLQVMEPLTDGILGFLPMYHILKVCVNVVHYT